MNTQLYKDYEKDGVKAQNLLSPELMTNVMHNLPGMAYRCINDGDWTMLFISEGCYSFTGYHPEELLYNKRLSYDDLIVPEDRELVRKAVEEGVANRSRFKMEYRIQHKDGRVIWVWEQGNAVISEEQGDLYLDGFIADISIRKEAEAQLHNLAKELSRINSLKDKFFNVIVHDLQNPIYAIISLSEFITQSNNTLRSEQIVDFCSQINSSAHRISNHLDNLLEWSKLQSGERRLRYTQVKLLKLVEEVIDTLRRQSVDKQIRFDLKIDPEICLSTDLRMLNSILRNLISNSLKYSDQGKSIHISAHLQESDLLIIVEDQGVGMPRSQIQKILSGSGFENKIGTANEPGNGMGLALVVTYIKQLGGEIEMNSKLHRGTTTKIRIPHNEMLVLNP